MTLTPLVLVDCRLYLDGADLTGYSNKAEVGAKANELDSTTFSASGTDAWRSRVGGVFDGQASLEGLWQAGDLSMPDDTFWADLGQATIPLTAVPTGGAVGDLAYLTRGLETNYKPGGKHGELLGWSADLATNWPILRGKILHPQGTARIASGNGTGLQLGAVSAAQRLYACLHVLSVAGTAVPTITVKVQSSVDNTFAAPTDRITFNAATALGGQASSVLGAVTDTWWRAVWTISGTNPSFLFAVSAGIGPK